MPSLLPFFNKSIKPYPYDPDKAKQMLKDAGVANLETELWYMPIPRPYMPDAKSIAQVMQQDLKKVGVNAKLVTYEWGTYLEKTGEGDHPMCLLGWTGDNGDPDNFLNVLLNSASATPTDALNVAYYKNPEVDKLLEKGQTTMDDNEREKAYYQAQEIMHEDAPWVPIAYVKPPLGFQETVQGFDPNPTSSEPFNTVYISRRTVGQISSDALQAGGGQALAEFIGRRILQIIPVLLGVSIVVFFLVRAIPGDPAQIMLGQQATQEQVQQLTEHMGLDKPISVQYGLFLKDAVRGDLGDSMVTGRPVTTELLVRFPATLGAHGVRHAHRHSRRGSRRGDRGRQAVLAARQDNLGPRAHGDKHAHLLARDDPDRDLRRQPGVLPFPGRLGPTTAITSITGLVLVDSLLTLNFAGFWDGLLHLIMPAIALGDDPYGRDHADDALQHARGHERGLREHGEGQGRRPLAGRLQARPEERHAADGNGDRAAGGAA